MTEQEYIYRRSEKYAEDEEIKQKNKDREYKDYFEKYSKEIGRLLGYKDEESRNTLLRIFADKKFQEVCFQTNYFAVLFMLFDIYSSEKNNNVQSTILDSGKDEAELRRVFWKIKRLLIRYELAEDNTAAELLIMYIRDKNISAIALSKFITWCAYDVEMIFLNIVFECLEKQMTGYSINLLRIGTELFPEREEFTLSLAKLLYAVGEKDGAIKCLECSKCQTENIKALFMEYKNG